MRNKNVLYYNVERHYSRRMVSESCAERMIFYRKRGVKKNYDMVCAFSDMPDHHICSGRHHTGYEPLRGRAV